jgi:hypothetical protein
MAGVIEIMINGSSLHQTEDGYFICFFDSGFGGWEKMPVEEQHAVEIQQLLQDGKLELGEPEYEY